MHLFNISVRRVGGLTWVRIGRLTMAFNVNRSERGYRPLGSGERPVKPRRYTERQLAEAFQRGMRAQALYSARRTTVRPGAL